MYKKLYKSRKSVKVDGVCAGIADYFNVDPTLVRLGFLAGLFVSGGTVGLAYLACSVIVPREPKHYEHNDYGEYYDNGNGNGNR